VTHWERTAKPFSRPLKVEELCKAFVLYREGKGLDKATLSEDRYETAPGVQSWQLVGTFKQRPLLGADALTYMTSSRQNYHARHGK
jgi:hypothetical protein